MVQPVLRARSIRLVASPPDPKQKAGKRAQAMRCSNIRYAHGRGHVPGFTIFWTKIDLAWFWSITEYVEPRSGLRTHEGGLSGQVRQMASLGDKGRIRLWPRLSLDRAS
jgi:hypothetical protein